MKTEKIYQLHQKLLLWYKSNSRELPWRTTDDPYCIWISEVMLQQTQVSTVIPYYLNFLKNYPDIRRLAASSEQQILKNWEGLGYYARARNLLKAAQEIVLKYDGSIPCRWDRFRLLPGIGDYIASAVLSIAYDLPYAVVDGNVKRVYSRLFCITEPVNRHSAHKVYNKTASAYLKKDAPGTYNQALMELGALVCRPQNPQCGNCPISDLCCAYVNDRIDEYPVRLKPAKTPVKKLVSSVIYKEDKLLIVRRPSEGLLGGLWEFPNGEVFTTENSKESCIRIVRDKVNLTIEVDRLLTRVNHAYTHFKIIMAVYYCRYLGGEVALNGPIDCRWTPMDKLTQFPLHRAVHKILPVLKQTDEKTAKRIG